MAVSNRGGGRFFDISGKSEASFFKISVGILQILLMTLFQQSDGSQKLFCFFNDATP